MIDVDRPLELRKVRHDINVNLDTLFNITVSGPVRGVAFTEAMTLIDELFATIEGLMEQRK